MIKIGSVLSIWALVLCFSVAVTVAVTVDAHPNNNDQTQMGFEDINIMFEPYLSGQVPINSENVREMYKLWQVQYNSVVPLGTEERFVAFETKIVDIIAHNLDPTNTYKRGLNQYSAMTREEFNKYFHLNKPQECSATNQQDVPNKTLTLDEIPENFDWRSKAAVSPVKNQGNCGSCWTFSTVGALESAHLIKYKSLETFSEQQLVDCAGAFHNFGCNGGLPSQAFQYIHYTGGITTEKQYPYTGKDGNCTIGRDHRALKVVHGSFNITEGDEKELLHACYEHGPISVGFQVVDGFGDYKSGVYSSKTCKNGPQDINHAVLVVGWGRENGVDYWLVKNSWGSDWGDHGFFKIERNVNMCGIAVCNSYPDGIERI